MNRRRLDAELVERGLVDSRRQAQTEIRAGNVLVDGVSAAKPAHRVGHDDPIELAGTALRYVSRAGRKLEHALDHFDLSVDGLRCGDVGASTGGFTDCLLQRGAAQVVAVDVGTGQLHPRLRADDRVTVLEQTDVRSLTVDDIGGALDLAAIDVSFISIRLVLPAVAGLVAGTGVILALVKPQFEVGRQPVAKGRGIVTDPALWRGAVSDAVEAAVVLGLELAGAVVSPLTGSAGNTEFVLALKPGPSAAGSGRATSLAAGDSLDRTLIDNVVSEAEARGS